MVVDIDFVIYGEFLYEGCDRFGKIEQCSVYLVFCVKEVVWCVKIIGNVIVIG